MASMTTLQLIVLLFVGLVYTQSEDLKCVEDKCVGEKVLCALCDGEYRFFRSECAVKHYCSRTPCKIVELEACFEKACPVSCKVICATDGEKYYSFKSECDYFNYICKTKQTLKEVDVRNCFAIKDTIE